MDTCKTCGGLGYIEKDHSIIRLPCPTCRAKKPEAPEMPQATPAKRKPGRPRKAKRTETKGRNP